MDMKRFEGLTIEDLEAAIAYLREEEAARAKEEAAALEEARLDLITAGTNYLYRLGVFDEEAVQNIDVNATLETLKETEGQITGIINMFGSKALFNPMKFKISMPLEEPGNDLNKLKDWLRTL